jgi:hypothetical protein
MSNTGFPPVKAEDGSATAGVFTEPGSAFSFGTSDGTLPTVTVSGV